MAGIQFSDEQMGAIVTKRKPAKKAATGGSSLALKPGDRVLVSGQDDPRDNGLRFVGKPESLHWPIVGVMVVGAALIAARSKRGVGRG